MGKPDQKDLNENMAATQGLSHMITDCKKLFQVGGCPGGFMEGTRPPAGQCHHSGSPRLSEGPAKPCSWLDGSKAAGYKPKQAVSVLPPSFVQQVAAGTLKTCVLLLLGLPRHSAPAEQLLYGSRCLPPSPG